MPARQYRVGHPESDGHSYHRYFHPRADTLTPAFSAAVAEYLPIAEPSKRDRCVSRARRQSLIIHHR